MGEYLCMGATNPSYCLQMFIKDVISMFVGGFLRPPGPEEPKNIMAKYKDLGFPGCKSSSNGMHWEWKNCAAGGGLISFKAKRRHQ